MDERIRTTHEARRSAFTLIELLVVIAIISLLVSILLPSLTKAKEMARSAVCMSNLRRLVLAWHMYATEESGQLPWESSSNATPAYHTYIECMVPYLDGEAQKNADEPLPGMLCPSATSWSQEVTDRWWTAQYAINYSAACSYLWEGTPSSGVWKQGSIPYGPWTMEDQRAPGEIYAFMDSPGGGIRGCGGAHNYMFRWNPFFYHTPSQWYTEAMSPFRHYPDGRVGTGLNAAYFDSHVEWVPRNEKTFPDLVYPGEFGQYNDAYREKPWASAD